MLLVARLDDAEFHDATDHYAMTAIRFQGEGVTEPEDFWVGLLTLLPGVGAGTGAVPTDKVRVVLEGHPVITTAGADTGLGPCCSACLPSSAERCIQGHANLPAQMPVIPSN